MRIPMLLPGVRFILRQNASRNTFLRFSATATNPQSEESNCTKNKAAVKNHNTKKKAVEIPSMKEVCSRYYPANRRFEMSFEQYKKLTLGLRRESFIYGPISYIVTIFMFVQLTDPGTELIWDIDPLIIYGGGGMTLGIIVAATVLINWPAIRLSTFWDRSIKPNYQSRHADLKRRLDLYKCKEGSESEWGDDYYGDKIKDLSDYRCWIRIQQEKKASFEKSSKIKLF